MLRAAGAPEADRLLPSAEPPTPSVGSASPRQHRVALVVERLVAASGGLLLPDALAGPVGHSIASLLLELEALLADEPRLRLDVTPWGLEHEGRRIGREAGDGRGLAFRLYRDGLRALVLCRGFDAPQLVQLLGILSTRASALHPPEDDAVGQLWRAGLRSVEVIAVDRFAAPELPPGTDAPEVPFALPAPAGGARGGGRPARLGAEDGA